jgi:hypothetical protein
MWFPTEKFERLGFEVDFLQGWGLMTPTLTKYGVNIPLGEAWGSVNGESHRTHRWYPLANFELRYLGYQGGEEEDSMVEEYYSLLSRKERREDEKKWGVFVVEKRTIIFIRVVREKYFPDYAVLCRFRSLPRSLQRWLKSPPWERVPSFSEGFHFALPKKTVCL